MDRSHGNRCTSITLTKAIVSGDLKEGGQRASYTYGYLILENSYFVCYLLPILFMC